jgi:hypothetical protein
MTDLGKKRAEELGLRLWSRSVDIYMADDIHKLLAEGVEVKLEEYFPTGWHITQDGGGTKALIIGITPIVEKSREEKMEELLREAFSLPRPLAIDRVDLWFERAKDLLNNK